MIGFKFTTRQMTTYKGFEWELDKAHTTSGEGGLCGPGWVHYYRDPLLAVLHNPIHADIKDPLLFECEVGGAIIHDGWMKSGCTCLILRRELMIPEVTCTQRVRYAIGCALLVWKEPTFEKWANGWLTGRDRNQEAAEAAAVRAAARRREAAWAAEAAREVARAAAAAAEAAAASAGEVKLPKIAAWSITSSLKFPEELK